MAAVLVGLGGCRAVITIGGRAEEDFDESATFEDVGSLEVDWRNGTIKVVFDENATRLTASGRKVVTAGTLEAADEGMDRFSIELLTRETAPPQMVVLFDAPSQGSVHFRADVEIVVPAGVALTINSRNGDVDVDGNRNDTSVTLDNGDVSIVDQNGAVAVVVENGDVSLLNVNGAVVVSVDDGDVEIDARNGDLEVEVDTGAIAVSAQPREGDNVIARTRIGTVTIRVPEEVAAMLQLAADIGLVDADLAAFTVTDLVSGLRRVSATLNGGGGDIVGSSGLGNVHFGSFD